MPLSDANIDLIRKTGELLAEIKKMEPMDVEVITAASSLFNKMVASNTEEFQTKDEVFRGLVMKTMVSEDPSRVALVIKTYRDQIMDPGEAFEGLKKTNPVAAAAAAGAKRRIQEDTYAARKKEQREES